MTVRRQSCHEAAGRTIAERRPVFERRLALQPGSPQPGRQECPCYTSRLFFGLCGNPARRTMQRDLDKMRRRPFFFPLVLPVLLFIAVVAAAAWLFDARATTVVFVVRHAEVETPADADSDLSVEGRERAARLAKMLSQARPVRGIDAIL